MVDNLILKVGAILIFAFFLRFYKLEVWPAVVNQDELSNIYDGISIAETGADRWGEKNPFILRAFGVSDNRPALFAWLIALNSRVFGNSIEMGRSVSGIVGCISLLLLFLIANSIGGQYFGLISLVLGCISPWHILFSRLALEAATLPSFFLLLTIFLSTQNFKKPQKAFFVIALGLTIGLAINAYQSTKLIFFILAILIFLIILIREFPKFKNVILLVIFTFIGAFPQVYTAIFTPERFFSRAIYTLEPFHFSLAYFEKIILNIGLNLSPDYLFFSFDYNNMSIARLIKIEFLFFYIGLFFFNKIVRKDSIFKVRHLLFLIVLAILPSAITVNNPHALRASSGILLYPMVTAAGILYVQKLITITKFKRSFIPLILVIIILNWTRIMFKYLDKSEIANIAHQHELVFLAKKVNQIKENYDYIFIENHGIQPYLYLAYYCNMRPSQFQTAQKKIIEKDLDKFVQMSNFYFFDRSQNIIFKKNKDKKKLIVLKEKVTYMLLMDSLIIPNNRFYFYQL